MSEDTKPVDVLPGSVIEIVKSLRCFFVENIRSARRFLKAVDREFDIDSVEFHVVDEHTNSTETLYFTEILKKCSRVGVVSEAGCPSIADPGALIVECARSLGFKIVPLIGPSSIMMGLMASGFNGQNFAFNGYLPHDATARKRKLKELAKKVSADNQTQIFIETPYRNNKLIEELAVELPADIKICVASELTSVAENISVKTAAEWGKVNYDYARKPSIFLIGR